MSQLLGSFRHKSGGGGWASSFSPPHYQTYKPTKKSSHDHSLIHNFLTDVRDAAVGIPMGLVDLGKAGSAAVSGNFHPLARLGGNIAHSYAYMYGPALHGHFGTVLHRMGQHPLQPLLDAMTIATGTPAAVGAGFKAADQLGATGERLHLVSAERSAALNRRANIFRPRTREVHVDLGHPSVDQSISGNPSIRAFQNLHQGTQVLLSKMLPSVFGEDGRIDLTSEGLDRRIHHKELTFKRSEREHAAQATFNRELTAARNMFKDNRVSSVDIAETVKPSMRGALVDHAFKVPSGRLIDFRPSEYTPASKKTVWNDTPEGKVAEVVDKAAKYKKAKGYLADGWLFISKDERAIDYPADKSAAEFGRWINEYGKGNTTPDINKALKDEHGNYLVVRTKTVQEMSGEAHRTYRALRAFYDTPTKVWKWMVLATAPRYFVNNVVGNGLMYAMAANPVDTTRGMFEAIRQVHGDRVARRSMNDVGKAQNTIIGDWVDKNFSATTEGFGHEMARDLHLEERFKSPAVRKAVKTAQGGLFGVTHFASDTIPRRAMINLFIRRVPEYQQVYRQLRREGMGGRHAHQRAAELVSERPNVRALITNQVNDVLGQYHHFNRTETGIKRLIPFYSWDRAIVRHSFHLAAERPAAASAMAQLGQEGSHHTLALLGEIPAFMKGVIPLEALGYHGGGPLAFLLGHGHKGRKQLLSTQGLNPYATLPDVADFVATTIHGNPQAGEALAGQLNPYLTGTIEHYTGQSLLSGKKMPQHGGLLRDIGTSVSASTPPVRLLQTAIQGRPKAKVDLNTGLPKSPLLYRGDIRQQNLSFLGVPVKEAALSKAHELGRREKGITLPKAAKAKPVKLTGFHHRSKSRHTPRLRRKPSLRLGSVPKVRKRKYLPNV